VKDLPAESHFFFRTPAEYDPESVGKRWNDHSPALMQQLRAVLKEVDDFNAENAEAAVKTWISEQQLPMGQVMNAFRICIVGELKGPGLFQIADLIGKKETLHRIDLAIAKLTPGNSQTL
jgi:glutamyl-tRNA synthetase